MESRTGEVGSVRLEPMRRLLAITLPASLLILGAALFLNTYQPPAVSNGINIAETPRHPVTEPMWSDAKSFIGTKAFEFNLKDTEDKEVTLKGLLQQGPVVVISTMDGCPCSLESQGFFNDIAKAYVGKVQFVGIMDAGRVVANKYKDDLSVPYPILCDPEKTTFRPYRSKQSVYVTLISQEGTVLRQWPGYSKTMLVDLSASIAGEVGVRPIVTNVARAPEEMTSGCYFYQEDDPAAER